MKGTKGVSDFIRHIRLEFGDGNEGKEMYRQCRLYSPLQNIPSVTAHNASLSHETLHKISGCSGNFKSVSFMSRWFKVLEYFTLHMAEKNGIDVDSCYYYMTFLRAIQGLWDESLGVLEQDNDDLLLEEMRFSLTICFHFTCFFH